MHTLSGARVQELSDQWRDKQIAVIGDLMLDRYYWGAVNRISPEAPVPVVDIHDESVHLGGASNVASNLLSLGAQPLMLGVIGDDYSGGAFMNIVRGSGLDSGGIVAVDSRPTTVKTRIIGNNQNIARLDQEVKTPIDDEVAAKLLRALEANADTLKGIIIQDYNKGVLTPALISNVIQFSKRHTIPVFVDPKFTNFFEFRGVELFKPNQKETQDALGISLNTEFEILEAGRELLSRLQCESVLITLGARGMMLFEQNDKVSSVSAKAHQVADVSGAGDTVIATIAAAMSGGANLREAATLANFAASVVCQEPGIVSIEPHALLKSVQSGS